MALNPVGLAPLAVVVAILGFVLLTSVDESLDRWTSQFARRLFGRYVSESPERERLLRSAFVDQTYRAYAARTFLYVGLAAIASAIASAYLLGGTLLILDPVLDLLQGLPPTMVQFFGIPQQAPPISERTTLALLVAAGVVGGFGGAGLTYLARWELPRSTAEARRRNIDEGLARTVAFTYALSRGGVSFPETLRTLADNEEIYGETAREVRVAVREMDLFGRDVISALHRMSERTPSEEFKTFSENLASVLQSGRSLSTFLHNQYERYQAEAADRQEEILERLATVAEAYVTVLVAAVLFLITILLVFGLTTTDTLVFLRLVGYVIVPLANLAFVVYLAQKLEALGIASQRTASILDAVETGSPDRPVPPGTEPRADGGTTAVSAERIAQLRFNERFARARRVLYAPLRTLRWYPSRILYLTVPLAVVYLLVRAPAAFDTAAVNVRLLDDVVVQATLFVLGTFALVRELYVRRVRRIEAATPELLERLASLNEAGMTVTESLDRLRDSDVGVLTEEVERIWADVTMGSNLEDALVRFGRRVRTTSITRVVTLLTNAMRASGSLGPVLRIAATQARADQRLRRRRRQQMLSYLVVIYISFLVFLIIIVAVQEVLVPSLPSHVPTPENTQRLGVDASQFARLGQVDKAAYTLVFFHTALVHAVCTGFVGGMLGEGSFRDGAKHAAVLLGVAYVAFVLLSSPVASITMEDPAHGVEAVTIDSVSVSDGGFVVLYQDDTDGPVVGHTAYLRAGTHENVAVQLDRSLRPGSTITAVAYLDSNDDGELAVPASPRAADGQAVDEPYPAPGQDEIVRVEVTVADAE